MYDYVHAHSRAKTMSHSCGSILNIIDHFINAGLDILNPVQSGAVRMDPVILKERFGGRIVFWGGGIDTQKVLPMPRLEAVREQAQDRIRTLAPGGGFVFAAEHNIQHGVPPENIVGLADTVYEFGGY
jgi:uroporphyrinogen decarboxylase